MQQIESIKESDGWLNRYTHESSSCQCEMTFSVYCLSLGGLKPPASAGSFEHRSVFW